MSKSRAWLSVPHVREQTTRLYHCWDKHTHILLPVALRLTYFHESARWRCDGNKHTNVVAYAKNQADRLGSLVDKPAVTLRREQQHYRTSKRDELVDTACCFQKRLHLKLLQSWDISRSVYNAEGAREKKENKNRTVSHKKNKADLYGVGLRGQGLLYPTQPSPPTAAVRFALWVVALQPVDLKKKKKWMVTRLERNVPWPECAGEP